MGSEPGIRQHMLLGLADTSPLNGAENRRISPGLGGFGFLVVFTLGPLGLLSEIS